MKSGVYINKDEGGILYLFGGGILVSYGNLRVGEYDALKGMTFQPHKDDEEHKVGEIITKENPDYEGAKPKMVLGFHNNEEIDHLISLLGKLKEIKNDKIQQK